MAKRYYHAIKKMTAKRKLVEKEFPKHQIRQGRERWK